VNGEHVSWCNYCDMITDASVPKTSLGLWARNQVSTLVGIPVVGDWIIRHGFRDDFELPDYAM
jgi:hypothetical protein